VYSGLIVRSNGDLLLVTKRIRPHGTMLSLRHFLPID
jgi:hypothetical protein